MEVSKLSSKLVITTFCIWLLITICSYTHIFSVPIILINKSLLITGKTFMWAFILSSILFIILLWKVSSKSMVYLISILILFCFSILTIYFLNQNHDGIVDVIDDNTLEIKNNVPWGYAGEYNTFKYRPIFGSEIWLKTEKLN
ncbi:MAG: hypothetical protein IPF62_09510 [Bacteroidetes bacterium]|nr:hypothetical protein [Bacteroidota bacterium]